ncbi:MAG: hypothetical protein HWN68_05030 [Desulfobacterales bacterium]|nr:hypothetical protein [Desulfobacterales bacterium]
MQSESHESLLKRLHGITQGVKAALQDEDAAALERLASEHNSVMNELNQAGFSADAALLGLVKELNDEVRRVVEKLGERRDEIGRQLVESGKRKKMVFAYAKNAWFSGTSGR